MAYRYQPKFQSNYGSPGAPQGNLYTSFPISGNPPAQPMSGYVLPPAASQPAATVASPATTSAMSLFGIPFKAFIIFMTILAALAVIAVVTAVVVTQNNDNSNNNGSIRMTPGPSTRQPADLVCPNAVDFNCGSGECISQSKRCDNKRDCYNGRDEDNCPIVSGTIHTTPRPTVILNGTQGRVTTTPPTGPSEQRSTYIPDLKCDHPGDFNCGAGQCVAPGLRCNNVVDCWNGWDEKDCANFSGTGTIHTTSPPTVINDIVCPNRSDFNCGAGACIPMSRKCDGRIDCWDGSDEKDCTSGTRLFVTGSTTPGNPELPCLNPEDFNCGRRQCVPQSAVCNYKIDCDTGLDEQFCSTRLMVSSTSTTSSPTGTGSTSKSRFGTDNDIQISTDRSAPFVSGSTSKSRFGTDNDIQISTDRSAPFVSGSTSKSRFGTDNDIRISTDRTSFWYRSGTTPKGGFGTDNDIFISTDRGAPFVSGSTSRSRFGTDNDIVSLDQSLPIRTTSNLRTGTTPPPSGTARMTTTPIWDHDCPSTDEFPCGSGQCIPRRFLCDGHTDCFDGRDERNCNCDPLTTFKCDHDWRCVLNTSICDYIRDCTDGSDEANCTYRDCNATEFRCQNEQCVPANRKCDQYYDCYDGSDEWNCPCNATTQFKCQDSGMCISIRSKCNYAYDCMDGSDERNCTGCDSYLQFKCVSSYAPMCIPNFNRCDGKFDCTDWSDERGCPCNNTNQFLCGDGLCIEKNRTCNFISDCRDGSDEANCTYRPCNSSEYRCNNSQCIPLSKRCDNIYYDCFDGSDEQRCPCNATYQYTCNQTGECLWLGGKCDGYANCPGGDDEADCNCDLQYQFQCGSYNPRCIGKHQRCDLVNDCIDKSDEMDCPCNKTGQFKCASGQCISNLTRCDFNKNCDDGSDELNCVYPPCNPSYQYTCSNGQCVYYGARCNGYPECIDKSDELFCPCNDTSYQFQCASGQCIGRLQRCDRYPYCDDHSDEMDCSRECASPAQTCANGFCLNTRLMCNGASCPQQFKCDGYTDCPDGSDETNCTTFYPTTQTWYWTTTWAPFTTIRDAPTGPRLTTRPPISDVTRPPISDVSPNDGVTSWSLPTWFYSTTTPANFCGWDYKMRRCNNGNCVYFRYFCDGGDDCGDGSDELNCTPQNLTLFQDNFLVFTSTERPGLYQLNLNTNEVKQILANKPVNPRAVAVDSKNKYIYYTEMSTQTIRRVTLNSHQDTVIYTHSENLTDFEGLTADPLLGRLYFTAQHYSTGYVYEVTLSNGQSKQLWNKNDSNPRGIVIEPGKGNLYWTECYYGRAAIVKTTVENSAVVKYLVQNDISFPQSLTIDFDKGIMYWLDTYLHKVEAAQLDGSKRRVIAHEFQSTYYALTISPYYVHIADWNYQFLKKVNRFSHFFQWDDRYYEIPGFSSIVGIAYYSTKGLTGDSCKGPGQYQCADSTCLGPTVSLCPYWWCDEWKIRCDGTPDCPDHSDELECTGIIPPACAPGQFECKDGRCVGMNEICQGYPRCKDKSDIEFCLTKGCPNGQFQCRDTAQCIEPWYRCDGNRYCGDASDELGCNCTVDQMKCANESMCVWKSQWCDGRKDCRDGSDESDCSICPEGRFKCANGTCVSNSSRCSIYYSNCPDGSDNIGCDDCVAKGGFLCNNGQCIPQSSVCNPYATIHCTDHSDQVNCNCSGMFRCDSGQCVPSFSKCDPYASYKCYDNSHMKGCFANNTCDIKYMKCDNGECVYRWLWCNTANTYAVCQDKSDLKYCTCKPTDIYCSNNQCVDGSKWCDGVKDCEDGYDESQCYMSSCPPNYYSCDTFVRTTTFSYAWYNQTQCVPVNKRCDGNVDCANMGDEIGCYCDPYFQFQCDNGRCINGTVWCDGKTDCMDSSDEPANCQNMCNPFLSLTCNNGRCVDKTARCDGVNNCGDYTDELNCTGMSTCYSGYYQCDMGLCVSKDAFCNGTKECPDGSDEKNQCETMCQPGYFTCNNSRCVQSYSLCNGQNDCGDYSDEINCPCNANNNQFRCDMGYCLSVSYYCDGYRDCPDGSDEKTDCKSKCPAGFFKCNATGQCMRGDLMCDRIIDCPDGSDEQHCSANCTADQYKCSGGQCIPKRWLCDGTKDCSEGDDEVSATCNVCTSTQHQCSSDQTCVDQSKICDGMNDCQDESDENNCFTTSQPGAVVNGYPTSIVQVKFKGAQFNYFCSEGFNASLIEHICQQMGYGAPQVLSSNLPFTGQYKTLKASHSFSAAADNFLAYFDVATCSDSQLLGINCSNLECGKRKISSSVAGPYVINGARAAPGAWPWHASLLIYQTVQCGGVILNDKWILTSAHCLDGVSSVRNFVTIGVGMTSRTLNESSAKNYYVDKDFVHPKYRQATQNNTFLRTYEADIALIKLSKSMVFSDYVQPICLPSPDAALNQFKVCVGTGFGETRPNQGSVSQYLLQGKMTPMSESMCRAAVNGTMLPSLSDDWYKSMFCAGSLPNEYGSNMCPGDDGGPLVCKDSNDNWSVLGVNIINQNCNWSGFTRVSEYLSWIQDTLTIYS